MTKEGYFQSKFKKKLEKKGWVIVKNSGLGVPDGFPDLSCYAPFGETFFIEAKADKQSPKQPLQDAQINRLKKMSFSASYVYPQNEEQILTEMGYYDV